MAKKTNPNHFDPIVVNGCLIEPDTVYEIVNKRPTGQINPVYVEMGSVKERFPGVSNFITLSRYDTGFYEGSPIFRTIPELKDDWGKRQRVSEQYYKIFAEPLRAFISDIERIKNSSDDEFFDKIYPMKYLTVDIREGAQFNTANPLDRIKLYIAAIEGEIVMKGKRDEAELEKGAKNEEDISKRDVQYCYVSLSKRKTTSEENAQLEMQTVYRYTDLVRKDKELIQNILFYMGLIVDKDYTESELLSIYKTKIETSKAKFKELVKNFDRYDEDGVLFETEMSLVRKLKDPQFASVLTKQGGVYYLGEVPLGSNHKSVVATLLKNGNEELYVKFNTLIDECSK